ncbi:MAG: hypothetical protein GY757_31645 [bacterium]|nr:hypothetical protein [bacterium]
MKNRYVVRRSSQVVVVPIETSACKDSGYCFSEDEHNDLMQIQNQVMKFAA